MLSDRKKESEKKSRSQSPYAKITINEISEVDLSGKTVDEIKYVLISSTRLAFLELMEKNIPNLILEGIKENKIAKLKTLHEKDKLNPAAVNLRVKRYNEKHKDQIAAKRNKKRMDKLIREGKTEAEINHIITKLKVVNVLSPETLSPKTKIVTISTKEDLIVRF
jgi:hypothetical protein